MNQRFATKNKLLRHRLSVLVRSFAPAPTLLAEAVYFFWHNNGAMHAPEEIKSFVCSEWVGGWVGGGWTVGVDGPWPQMTSGQVKPGNARSSPQGYLCLYVRVMSRVK